tara:strand:- start:226 stop:543 length:318 start_codon:yes stop_codon:yes gene_type:complete
MIPGSLPNLISGFVDYSAKKCNLRKNENFQSSVNEEPNMALFWVLMIILVGIFVLYTYSFLVLPWKIASKNNSGILFKLFLVFCFLMLPVFNLGYLANYTRKTLE